MKSIEINYSKPVLQCLIPILLIILINPLIGFAAALMMFINAPDDYDDNRSECVTFLLSAAIWLGLINITKSISSDQYAYASLFLQVPEKGFYGTVFHAWGGSGKEPVYSFITWCLYWLTGGSLRLFFFTMSMGIYLFIYFAVYKLFKAMNQPKGALICGVLAITFFTQYFVMTLHIVRQILAASVVIYAIVCHAVNGKNNWWLLVSSVLIHTSAIFLALLSVVPWFYKPMGLKKICIVLGCFIPIIVFNGVIADKLSGATEIEAINYGLSRYGNSGESDGIVISLDLMLIVFVPLAIAALKLLAKAYSSGSSYEENEELEYEATDNREMIFPIVYIFLLLMIFVLSFTKSPLVQYRFFYYCYTFIPLLLPLIFVKPPINKIYWTSVSLFFIIRFFIIHNSSDWRYLSVSDMLTSTIFYYWTGDFHWMYEL